MEIQERINNYWSKRANEFSECRLEDFEGFHRKVWTDIIREVVPSGKGLSALDIGTGAGFYAFLLADLGFEVTAVDYSQSMIDNAVANAEKLGYKGIKFIKMDAQNLEFEDKSFDFIISRNVTWTLPDPRRAYEEWCRVLASGGKILNFDANYGQAFKLAEEAGQTYREMQNWSWNIYKRPLQSEELIRERNELAKQLYIYEFVRPQWDVDILLQNGISKISIDTKINSRVYANIQGDETKNNDITNNKRKFESNLDMFMIYAVK